MRVKANGVLNKVILGAIGAGVGPAVVIILVWGISLTGVVVPPHVQAAIEVILAAIGSLVAGYLTPIAAGEVSIVGKQPPIEVTTPNVTVTETEGP